MGTVVLRAIRLTLIVAILVAAYQVARGSETLHEAVLLVQVMATTLLSELDAVIREVLT